MLRTFLLLFVLSMSSTVATAKDIFIHSHNPISNRLAVFEDNEKVAFLYLTKAGTQKPEKDAIAYSRVPLVAKVDWKRIKETGESPPLSQEVASPTAIVTNPVESEFSFKWSADGHAVALLRQGTPIAFATASDKFGYSKLSRSSVPLQTLGIKGAMRAFSESRPNPRFEGTVEKLRFSVPRRLRRRDAALQTKRWGCN